MSAQGMTVTVMAGQLTAAVAKDETEGGGCDISAGLYGPYVSALLREWAALIVANSVTG